MSYADQLILTAVGPDEVGLVQKLSRFISSRGCNIEDSKMAVFCGEFAIILLITGDSEKLELISEYRREIEMESGLSINIKTPSARKPTQFYVPYRLDASCMDHPGIVYQISGVLSGFGINIESLETLTYPAPVSGTPLFRLQAHLAVPTRTNIDEVLEHLERLQRDENIDIDLSLQSAG